MYKPFLWICVNSTEVLFKKVAKHYFLNPNGHGEFKFYANSVTYLFGR